ncbi:hypothetical protein E4T49_06310 [Aureobasidium sp. EXF-10728]|nr:hypothetical protein E4T49_06310 [Aureobasidium sp. EXF-10728]
MPPRPFPLSLSVGTDLCHHTRFLKYFPLHQHLSSTTTFLSSQTLLFRLFDKAFLPSEQRAFWRKFQDAAPTASYRRLVLGREQRTGIQQWDEQKAIEAARYLGGRWAAKEAVIKAFSGMRRLMLRDVVIRTEGKGKAPVAIVLDESSGEETAKSQSAQEVYAQLVKRWEFREQLKELQSEDGGSMRIVKKASMTRHTAREQEMKKRMPGQQDEQQISPPSSTTAPKPAAAATKQTSPTPPILSQDGILDLSAITQILEQHQNTSSSTSSSSTPTPPQTPTPEPNDAKPEPQDAKDTKNPQTSLEEEISRLRRQEQQLDAFNNLQGQVVKISISHDGEYCVATALAAV